MERFLLEKSVAIKLLKGFPCSYATRKYNTCLLTTFYTFLLFLRMLHVLYISPVLICRCYYHRAKRTDCSTANSWNSYKRLIYRSAAKDCRSPATFRNTVNSTLTPILLTRRIWWAPINATRRQMEFNPLTPNDNYSGRTAPLTSKRCILYIYSTNIGTEYFKHGIYSPFFSSWKCSLFHNSNVFGSCINHILFTGCAKIKKIIPAPKG